MYQNYPLALMAVISLALNQEKCIPYINFEQIYIIHLQV